MPATMKRIVFVLSSLLLLAACGSPTPDPASTEPDLGYNPDTHVLLEIKEKSFEMGIPIPLDIAATHIPHARFNDGSGVMEVEAGPAFQIDITEEITELSALKADLRSDQLFTWKFSEESDDAFVAQAVLPTGESHYYHFFYITSIGERSYTMRSKEGSTFTLASIHTMRSAVEALVSNP